MISKKNPRKKNETNIKINYLNQKNEILYLNVDSYCSIESICIGNSLKNEIEYVKNQSPAQYLY